MVVLLLAACQDNKVGTYNTPPTVSVVTPADGSHYNAGDLVEFYGLARDSQTPSDRLQVLWMSDLDGELNAEPPDVSGDAKFSSAALSSGTHTITFTAVDENAASAETSIRLEIGPGSDAIGTPAVTILSPAPNQQFSDGETVNLVATATDDVDAYDTLQVEVVDVPDGTVWTGTPTVTGSITAGLTPSVGNHALTVYVTDADGKTGSATVAYEVLDDGRPTVVITEPADGSVWSAGSTVTFRGTVADNETAPDELAVEWRSDRMGVFSTNPADSSGDTSVGVPLTLGVHTITLSATDSQGKSGSDSIVIEVFDPLDVDDDGDGWTENEGDCDDADAASNPGATDICDDADNDCSGEVNDPYQDGYEANDTAWGFDCGEVDSSWLWTGSTLTLSGLTLHEDDDEDWFQWSADDEFYDNVSISVTASGLPSSGHYVLELYSRDSGRVEDSASGSASLTVTYSGDILDDGEDRWAVRVYASSWPSGSCSTTYTLNISS